jgi:hypothetical protein
VGRTALGSLVPWLGDDVTLERRRRSTMDLVARLWWWRRQ